ncbi:hypothetical protein QUF58_11845 [Anaerolineales bacterium HSG24]|nr:hypothetical protein [Anaerolineales bacterium HSG24]
MTNQQVKKEERLKIQMMILSLRQFEKRDNTGMPRMGFGLARGNIKYEKA